MLRNLPVYIISGIIGLVSFYAGFTGKRILFVSGPRSAVIVLVIIGIIMCSSASMGIFISKAPAHPLTIIGYILGSLALFTGVVQIFRLKVHFFSDPKNALFFIVAVIVVKFIIARLSFLIRVHQ